METVVKDRNGDATDTDTLLLFGGVACLVLGAGLVLSNSTVRRYLGEVNAGDMFQIAIPDVQRYLKLRGM